jgi:AAA family ATP:ADP antiporter
MQERVRQLFRLRPGEAGTVFVLGLLLLSNSLAIGVANVVSVSGFLNQVDVPNILIVIGVDMLLLLLTIGLQSLIIDRFDRVRLLRGTIFIFALVYVFLRFLFSLRVPPWLGYSLLYLVGDQQWLFFPLVFWILANDVFDMAQAKRLFPPLAAFGFIGQILGLSLSAAAPHLLSAHGIPSVELLTLNALIYLFAYILVTGGLRGVRLRQFTPRSERVHETLAEGWGFVREVPSFRYLVMAMLAVGLTLMVVDYHFLFTMSTSFPQASAFQTFYGLYRLGETVLAILLQSFVTSRIIDRITLKNTFLFLPVTLLAGVTWVIAMPGIIGSAGGRALSRLIFNTVDDSARKAFQALVPEERRGRVSIFIEGYLPSLGTIVGCLITGAIVFVGLRSGSESYIYVYLAVAGLAAIFAFWAILKMRTVYDSSLFNWRLKRRQRRSDVLDKLDF